MLVTSWRPMGGHCPAHDTLAALAGNPAYFQTVLTGNLREVARIKLEVFGLDQYLHLESGAYGDDHQERAELLAVAQRRAAERAGTAFGNDSTVLIGDTPNDVSAGRQAGVRVLGVATGKTSVEELRSAEATWAVDSLDQARQVLTAL